MFQNLKYLGSTLTSCHRMRKTASDYHLFHIGSLVDASSVSGYTATKVCKINEQVIAKDVKKASVDVLWVFSRNLPEEMKKNQEWPQYSRCPVEIHTGHRSNASQATRSQSNLLDGSSEDHEIPHTSFLSSFVRPSPLTYRNTPNTYEIRASIA
jgi:hypothetical protein